MAKEETHSGADALRQLDSEVVRLGWHLRSPCGSSIARKSGVHESDVGHVSESVRQPSVTLEVRVTEVFPMS